jgi:apolipoprotein N-acyltransferase
MKPSQLFLQARLLVLSLTGGILMGLTPAPVEAWPLAWIAVVPLWFLVANGKSIRQCALYGLVWGIGYHGLALFWITGIHPMTWMGVPWLASLAIAFFCWSFITLWGGILVAVWAAFLFWILDFAFWINQKPKISAWVRVLIGTALWCGLEAFWSAGSLWWSSLSYTQSPHNLLILHLGQLSGPSTVTAAIVAVNGLIAEAWISYQQSKGAKGLKVRRLLAHRGVAQVEDSGELKVDRLKVEGSNLQPANLQPANLQSATLVGMAVGLLIILHLIGFGLYSRPLIQPTVAALKVGIIQGNIPNTIKLYSEGGRRALYGYRTGYQTLADRGVDAVLTPEGALPFLWTEQVRAGNSFYSAVLEKGIVAWLGAFGEQGRSYTNSLFTIASNGETFSRYDKVKLVPLGEYIPFEQFLGGLVDRLSPLEAHQVAGSPTQLFDTPFGRAIAGICYESAFSKHFRRQAAAGGQFILSSSNNAHYSPSMPAQHHAQDVMRAIETDRWAVRATNTGYSAIVDPHGRTLWISGINTYEIHAHTVYRRQTQTLYVRLGDWLTPVLLGGAGLSRFVFNRR